MKNSLARMEGEPKEGQVVTVLVSKEAVRDTGGSDILHSGTHTRRKIVAIIRSQDHPAIQQMLNSGRFQAMSARVRGNPTPDDKGRLSFESL